MTAASSDRRLSIVIPAKNESGAIGGLVTEIRRLHADAEVIVVDDGSDDDTASQAERAGATVVKHPISLGNGAAVKAGAKSFKTPGEMGLRDIRIIEKIYESAAKGGVSVAAL